METKIEFRHYIVIRIPKDKKADSQKIYYILVIREKSLEKEYKRLKVRKIKAHYILKESDPGKLI